ncbi:MAG: hypothetical protein ABJB66_07220 [Gemmatimonadaceae bacterium]
MIISDIYFALAKTFPYLILGGAALWLLRRYVIASERRMTSSAELEVLQQRTNSLELQLAQTVEEISHVSEGHTFMMRMLTERSRQPQTLSSDTAGQ